LKILGARQLVDIGELPSRLIDIEWPKEEGAVKKRTFELVGRSRINGKPMNMSRIDEVVTIGSAEIWEIRDLRSEMYHNFHVHGIHFAVLELNGKQSPDHLRGWKDTVFLPSESSASIIARFDVHAGANTPLMYHCHTLMHEDQGMMGQFIVVAPGADSEGHSETHLEHVH